MGQQRSVCPDCQSEMRPIKLIDSTGKYHSHRQLGYAAGEAERGWFLGRYPEEGKVAARMCPSCGRIVLHAESESPNEGKAGIAGIKYGRPPRSPGSERE